jgi:hypothetical protein
VTTTPAAISATTPAVAMRARRGKSGTGRTNDSIPHPRSTASLRSARSGFTANACPTVPSIGASVIESEYA